jgi:hypothetical protein
MGVYEKIPNTVIISYAYGGESGIRTHFII